MAIDLTLVEGDGGNPAAGAGMPARHRAAAGRRRPACRRRTSSARRTQASYSLVAGLAGLDMLPARWLVAELLTAVCQAGEGRLETEEGRALLDRLGAHALLQERRRRLPRRRRRHAGSSRACRPRPGCMPRWAASSARASCCTSGSGGCWGWPTRTSNRARPTPEVRVPDVHLQAFASTLGTQADPLVRQPAAGPGAAVAAHGAGAGADRRPRARGPGTGRRPAASAGRRRAGGRRLAGAAEWTSSDRVEALRIPPDPPGRRRRLEGLVPLRAAGRGQRLARPGQREPGGRWRPGAGPVHAGDPAARAAAAAPRLQPLGALDGRHGGHAAAGHPHRGGRTRLRAAGLQPARAAPRAGHGHFAAGAARRHAACW